MWTSEAATIVGTVRTAEIRVAPEVGGQLVAIKVRKGASVHTGDVVAELSALELTAAVVQARATLTAAIASRDHIFAGVRVEQIAALAAEVAKAESRLKYAQARSAAPPILRAGTSPRNSHSTRPRAMRRRPAPTSPRRASTMPPRKRGRPTRSAPLRMRR
jgi:multidrug resistance efflux pump